MVVRLDWGLGVFDYSMFKEPETPEEKSARERDEKVKLLIGVFEDAACKVSYKMYKGIEALIDRCDITIK